MWEIHRESPDKYRRIGDDLGRYYHTGFTQIALARSGSPIFHYYVGPIIRKFYLNDFLDLCDRRIVSFAV